ncbi:TPA: hypothetical protein DDW35_02280, partial [Candidatus Sumerlaeota bacterium]|nr:hypothetical protein [Candidatus Sumerlaeota bacterium]
LFFAFVLTLLYAGWHGARCAETLAGMAALLLFLLDSLGDYSFFVRELYVVVCLIAGVVFGVSSVKDCPSHRYTCWLSVALCVAGLAVSIAPTQMILQDKRTLQDLWGELRSANPEEARQIALDSWEIAENAVRKNPANPSVWQLHSYAASYMGHPEIALTDLKKAATLNPYSAQLRADLARCEWERGNRNEALDWVSQAIALYPLRSGHYVLRATFLQKMGRSVEALADAQKANQVAFTPLEQAECAKLLETLSRAKQN